MSALSCSPTGVRTILVAALGCLAVAGCMPRATVSVPSTGAASPAAASAAPIRERLAALALRQTAFGSISLIPVRFGHSRISKPFVDGGRTLYCISTRMTGRSFGKGERPKIVVQEAGNALTIVDEVEEVCEGHSTEPFTELDSPVAGGNGPG